MTLTAISCLDLLSVMVSITSPVSKVVAHFGTCFHPLSSQQISMTDCRTTLNARTLSLTGTAGAQTAHDTLTPSIICDAKSQQARNNREAASAKRPLTSWREHSFWCAGGHRRAETGRFRADGLQWRAVPRNQYQKRHGPGSRGGQQRQATTLRSACLPAVDNCDPLEKRRPWKSFSEK